MRIAFTLIVFGCGLSVTLGADDKPTPEEGKAVADLTKLGGKASVDPKH